MKTDQPAAVIPLVEERIAVRKRQVETGRIRVRTVVDEEQVLVSDELVQGGVRIERVAVGRAVQAVPEVREEGGTIILPVVEERLVVEKRLVLVEEVHIHRTAHVDRFEQPVAVRRQRAVVEPIDPRGGTHAHHDPREN